MTHNQIPPGIILKLIPTIQRLSLTCRHFRSLNQQFKTGLANSEDTSETDPTLNLLDGFNHNSRLWVTLENKQIHQSPSPLPPCCTSNPTLNLGGLFVNRSGSAHKIASFLQNAVLKRVGIKKQDQAEEVSVHEIIQREKKPLLFWMYNLPLDALDQILDLVFERDIMFKYDYKQTSSLHSRLTLTGTNSDTLVQLDNAPRDKSISFQPMLASRSPDSGGSFVVANTVQGTLTSFNITKRIQGYVDNARLTTDQLLYLFKNKIMTTRGVLQYPTIMVCSKHATGIVFERKSTPPCNTVCHSIQSVSIKEYVEVCKGSCKIEKRRCSGVYPPEGKVCFVEIKYEDFQGNIRNVEYKWYNPKLKNGDNFFLEEWTPVIRNGSGQTFMYARSPRSESPPRNETSSVLPCRSPTKIDLHACNFEFKANPLSDPTLLELANSKLPKIKLKMTHFAINGKTIIELVDKETSQVLYRLDGNFIWIGPLIPGMYSIIEMIDMINTNNTVCIYARLNEESHPVLIQCALYSLRSTSEEIDCKFNIRTRYDPTILGSANNGSLDLPPISFKSIRIQTNVNQLHDKELFTTVVHWKNYVYSSRDDSRILLGILSCAATPIHKDGRDSVHDIVSPTNNIGESLHSIHHP